MPTDVGKSSLHARMTGSRSDIGPYPYTTHLPVPRMLPFEDIHFQRVDLPPVSGDFMEPRLSNALQPADGVLLVIDVSDPDCLEQVPIRALEIVRVYTKTPGKAADIDKPFRVRRGGTVLDVARLVHKDVARGMKFARMWGAGVFDGQQVEPEHLVSDGDVVELRL